MRGKCLSNVMIRHWNVVVVLQNSFGEQFSFKDKDESARVASGTLNLYADF